METEDQAPREERIVIRCPVGASDAAWGAGLSCARTFASSFIDRRAGDRRGVGWAFPSGLSVWCYWTTSRTVIAVVTEAR